MASEAAEVKVLITGGTQGIGLACARRFAREGCHLFLGYGTKDEQADYAAAMVKEWGGQVTLVKEDLSATGGFSRLTAAVGAETSCLDVVIHCAVAPVTGPLTHVEEEELERAMRVNGLGLVHLSRALSPLLGAGSSVVYLSSQGSQRAIPQYGPLGISKATAESAVRYLAAELGGQGVRFNTVMAGPVDTGAFRAMFPGTAQERIDAANGRMPSDEPLTPERIADVVRCVCDSDMRLVQGQTIVVDGGLYLA